MKVAVARWRQCSFFQVLLREFVGINVIVVGMFPCAEVNLGEALRNQDPWKKKGLPRKHESLPAFTVQGTTVEFLQLTFVIRKQFKSVSVSVRNLNS